LLLSAQVQRFEQEKMGRFDALDKEYNEIVSRVEKQIESIATEASDARHGIEKQIKADISEADSLVAQLEYEVRGMASTHRQAMSRRCQTYRDDIKKLRDRTKRALANADDVTSRDQLMEMGEMTSERQKMISSTQRLNETSDRVRRAKETAFEIEDIGMATMDELEKQRDTIHHSRQRIADTNLIISKSKRLVHGMVRRMKQSKAMMYFVIAALFIIIIVIIYYKWIKN
jgi:vesicle transport through interaction with t-SNAREs protein 1